ncbi:MAG: hypothetical protein A3J38_02265 [Gammaproteobacteria bacterium RIFCSPHIGHO2_12_FULL_45_9]|nr:MAG: hypothetical protein A3J38_02265 [Gammaproteobacteria bacterium RIFCSPHIGHO2_12_FULL_45_9]
MNWTRILSKSNDRRIIVLCASTALLLAGLYLDSYPCWVKWKNLQRVESELKWNPAEHTVLAESNNKLNLMSVQINQSYRESHFLQQVLQLSQLSGLVVNKLQILPTQAQGNIASTSLHITALGNMSHVWSFLSSLFTTFHLLWVTELTLTRFNNDRLLMNAEMVFFPRYLIPLTDVEQRLIATFKETAFLSRMVCLQPLADSFRNSLESDMQLYPLASLKVIGLIHVNGDGGGLILLPNNTVSEAKQGSLLGVEKAKLLTVLHDGVVVMLPDHRRVMMKLQISKYL